MKKLISLILITLLMMFLGGCVEYEEELKVGDTVTTKKSIMAGDTIENWYDAYETSIKTGVFRPNSRVTSLFDGEVVLIIDENIEEKMFKIRILEDGRGYEEIDSEWWVSKNQLKDVVKGENKDLEL